MLGLVFAAEHGDADVSSTASRGWSGAKCGTIASRSFSSSAVTSFRFVLSMIDRQSPRSAC